jgi:hypothetical protein
MKKVNITIYLILIFLFISTITVFSEIIFKTIQVVYMDLKINVNGKSITSDSEPFVYNGRTFVPIRFISEALNKDVIWNDKAKTIDINDKK